MGNSCFMGSIGININMLGGNVGASTNPFNSAYGLKIYTNSLTPPTIYSSITTQLYKSCIIIPNGTTDVYKTNSTWLSVINAGLVIEEQDDN